MRAGPPDDVLRSVFGWACRIQSWSPTGELLAADVPITSGTITWDVTRRAVPDQGTITVPRYTAVDGHRFDWWPHTDTHPLAEIGNTLAISAVIWSAVSGRQWVTPLARLLIDQVEEDEAGQVKVAAVGLLQRAADDKLLVAQSPDQTSTLLGEIARLLPGSLALRATGVADRGCQPGTQWSGSRIDALYSLADALPALLRSGATGDVVVLPPLPDVPALCAVYRDGEVRRGPVVDGVRSDMPTLISAPRTRTRDGVVNSITVTSQVVTDGIPAAYVVVEQATGPFAVDTYGRVNAAWTSEQITTQDEALAAGAHQLATGLRPARTMQVQAAPDPRSEVDDPVEVIRDGVRRTGWVLAQTLDLTGTTPMTLTVGVVDEQQEPQQTSQSLFQAMSKEAA
jgi:hypothetical protein